MIQTYCAISEIRFVAPGICEISMTSPEIASTARPGQFINIKVGEFGTPLLRRPFSVYRTQAGEVRIIFAVIGTGTKVLSARSKGDTLDVIGPLGRPFGTEGDFDTALLVAGGLGIAPMPMVSAALRQGGKTIRTFIGARTSEQLITSYCASVLAATDDGSSGYKGTVVDLLRSHLAENSYSKPKIFACGPNPMLKSLSLLAAEYKIPCEVSLESAMACGIGICQGCPVEKREGESRYSLVCREGPVFESHTILLD